MVEIGGTKGIQQETTTDGEVKIERNAQTERTVTQLLSYFTAHICCTYATGKCFHGQSIKNNVVN